MKISDVIIDMHQGINTVADKVEYFDSGIPIIQSKNFTKGYLDLEDVRYLDEDDEKKYIDKYNPHVGDILMANIGTIGKSYVISEEQRFLIAWNAFLIKPNAEKVKSEFLKFYFDYLAATHYFDGLLTGGTVKFINKKKIGDIAVPDKSIDEQAEICDVLSKVEYVLIQRHKELELLDSLIKARFVEMFGDPMVNSKGYAIKPYGDLFELNAGGTPSKAKPEYWEDGTISWIGSNLCQNVILYENDGKYISQEGYDHSSARLFPIDTVLIALVGATIGKTALLKFETSTNQNVLGVRHIVESGYNPMFVYYYTQFLYQKFINIGDGGFNMASKGFVSELPMYDIDLSVQNEFAAFAKQVDKSKFAVQKSLEETQLLFDSLMQQYFG